jgi:hypothetical protein
MRFGRWRCDGWLVLVLSLAIPVALYSAKQSKRRVHLGEPLVQSDGILYFAYLPSVVFDGDLRFENDYAALGVDLEGPRRLQPDERTGHVPNVFPVGTAMLWAPAYLAAHGLALALLAAGYPVAADGRGPVYQAAVLLATQVYVLLGLLLLYRTLRDWFERPVAAMAVIGIFAGSSLVYNTVLQASFAHGPSFFLSVALLGLCRARGPGQPRPLSLGLTLGLLAATRPEALLFAGFPVAALLRDGLCRSRTRQTAARLAVFGAGVLLALSPQLLVWQLLFGVPIDPRANLSFFHAHYLPLLELLYSSRNGLLSWSPLLAPSMLGLMAMVRRDAGFAVLALATLVAFVVMMASAADWWGGAAFGARRFVVCLPLFAVGLARAIEGLSRSPRLAVGIVLAAFIGQNLLNMEALRRLQGANSHSISFQRLAAERYRVLQSLAGSPALFPIGLLLARRHHIPPERLDEIWGTDLRADLHSRLEFDAPEHASYLGRGFSPPMRTGQGRSACWMTEAESTVLVQIGLSEGRRRLFPRRLVLSLAAFPRICERGPPRSTALPIQRSLELRVLINGVLTNVRRVPNRMRFVSLRLHVPEPSPWVVGINEVRLVLEGGPATVAPARLLELCRDRGLARSLGLDVAEARELVEDVRAWPEAPRAAVDWLVFR